MEPLISIITVSYNSEKTIKDTIQSVLDQTYDNIEYIIVDGASNDGTLDIIKSYQSQFASRNIPYRFSSESDNGIYDAMNKGIAKCTGTLIGIINSDDWYEKDALERVASLYSQNTDCDIFHSLLRFFDTKGSPESIAGHYSSFLDVGMIEHPTCFIKKDCYHHVGMFNVKYKSAADYEWMQRARKAGLKFLFSPHLTANFRRGGMSESHTGFLEELAIKGDYGLISQSKLLLWTTIVRLKSWVK